MQKWLCAAILAGVCAACGSSSSQQSPAPEAPPVESCLLERCSCCGAPDAKWVAVPSSQHVRALPAMRGQTLFRPSVAPRGDSPYLLHARPRGPPAAS